MSVHADESRERIIALCERETFIEHGQQGPSGKPGKDATDPAAIGAAIEDWLANNDLPGTVRYDVAQSLSAPQQEQARANVGLSPIDCGVF
jgi:hypothetical protein